MPWKIPGYALSIVHGQIHVTFCSTYLLNNKHYNTCFYAMDAEYYCGYVNRMRNLKKLL